MDDLSENEHKIVMFLSNKMEASYWAIGKHCILATPDICASSAAAYLGHLRKKGYVMRIPELKAWRLTKKGRDYVAEIKPHHA